jgi:serine/threonine protein kinase
LPGYAEVPVVPNAVTSFCHGCWKPVPSGGRHCDNCLNRRPPGGWLRETFAGKTVGGGKYRIVEPFGAGGFGVTAKAMQYVEGACLGPVVLKFPARPPEEFDHDAFFTEAAVLRMVCHPNIVTLHEAFIDHGSPFLVMEHVSGGRLYDAVRAATRARRLSLGFVLRTSLQVAKAIQALHEVGVVHGDIKPTNIALVPWLEAEPDFARLLDFGIAGLSQRTDTSRVTGEGTLGFAAPEQLAGKPSVRSDVFSFGVMLYWMLTAALPYQPDEFLDVEGLTGRSLPAFPRGVPPALGELVRWCLELEEAKRCPVPPVEQIQTLLKTVDTAGDPGSATDQQEILKLAREALTAAGLSQGEAEKSALYRRSHELFLQAQTLGPLPAAVHNAAHRAEENAKRHAAIAAGTHAIPLVGLWKKLRRANS